MARWLIIPTTNVRTVQLKRVHFKGVEKHFNRELLEETEETGWRDVNDYGRWWTKKSRSSYLSFWQTKRLKAFSAPRKLSSSRISTALIQLGLKSRAICWKTKGNGKLQGGAGLKLGCFMPPRELCIMHKHWRCWLWISPNAVNTDFFLNYET